MTEAGPGIALIFDDDELGAQLRLALQDHGARIVHEGNVASLSRDVLVECGADVVVVNLDDEDDASLDHLYDVIDGDSPRVVFNDGQASRALGGWDRARWARHLAAKVMASADVDPPRPPDAVGVEVPVAVLAPVTESVELMTKTGDASDESALAGTVASDVSGGARDLDEVAEAGEDQDAYGRVDSGNLEAELEAMLARDDLSANEDEFNQGLPYVGDDTEWDDGEFGEPSATVHDDEASTGGAQDDAGRARTESTIEAAFAFDHLPSDLTMADGAANDAEKVPGPNVVNAPDSWALLDDDAPVGSAQASDAAPITNFGVVKQTAAEFLAPEVEDAAPATEPVMSLELVTMEEAVAPQPYAHASEMHLDDNSRRLQQVVLLGAAANGLDSVCDFLSALPPHMRLTFLLTQHLGAQSMAAVMDVLSASGPLTVRLATDGGHAGPGEVLVVPAACQVSLRRDGGITVLGNDADAGNESSIDANFSTVANIFGRDVVSIVFAGRSTDAVAGAQAVHDLGGEVWVEATPDAQYSDMVGGIVAERLVSFSGTPRELAAHLIEVYP